jgi:hypothetical protein
LGGLLVHHVHGACRLAGPLVTLRRLFRCRFAHRGFLRLCYKTSNYQTPNYKTPKKQNIELQNTDYKTSKVTKGRITKRRKLQKVEEQKVESNKILQKAQKSRKLENSL